MEAGKAFAKSELQREAGLPVDPSRPVFGFIGRLEEQKGVDIVLAAIKKLPANTNAQIVILGTGKKALEAQVKNLAKSHPGVAAGVVKFSNPMAHTITAGADFMVVPSRFEPCGLIQLHAMQYGTVPLVASTGGLVDTVKEGVTGFQMGAMDPDTLQASDAGAWPLPQGRGRGRQGDGQGCSLGRGQRLPRHTRPATPHPPCPRPPRPATPRHTTPASPLSLPSHPLQRRWRRPSSARPTCTAPPPSRPCATAASPRTCPGRSPPRSGRLC